MWLVFTALTYASEDSANSRQGVQPFLIMYSTCLAIASSSRGGRKEKVSKNLKMNDEVGVDSGDRHTRRLRASSQLVKSRRKIDHRRHAPSRLSGTHLLLVGCHTSI